MYHEALYGVVILNWGFSNVLAGDVLAFLSTLPNVPMTDSLRNVMAVSLGGMVSRGIHWRLRAEKRLEVFLHLLLSG